jgi:prolyl-tRNA editing enzyme YbaK/EbsC (Cys-tRNA(Pro) deacylase)
VVGIARTGIPGRCGVHHLFGYPSAEARPLVDPPADESVRRVRDALERSGFGLRVVYVPRSARTARDAASALGCDLNCIVKSLVFRGRETGKTYLVEVGGTHRADVAALALAAGENVEMAPPDYVLAQTGFPVGGVAPVGHLNPVDTLIDETLLAYGEIWASAGSDRAMFRLTPAQLIQLTGGKPVRVATE